MIVELIVWHSLLSDAILFFVDLYITVSLYNLYNSDIVLSILICS